jgi:hypothetical protein
VTAVDLTFERAVAGERVTADARALPFPDRSFDVVVALDMLEHVPRSDRSAVLDELARVSRRRLIVGCPTGPRALECDRALARMLDRRAETYAGSWLEEHLEHGFPSEDELDSALRPHGTVRLLPNENVRAHELLMRAEMTRRPRRLADFLARALEPGVRLPRPGWRRLTIALLRGLDRGTAYRTIAVVDR